MKLDAIEKLIAAASPGPWPSEFGRCDFPDVGSMACGPIVRLDEDEDGLTDEDEECRRAQADQDFIRVARELMPKLVYAAQVAASVLSVLECGLDVQVNSAIHKCLAKAIAELEQP